MALWNGSNKKDVNLVCKDIVANQMCSSYFRYISATPGWLEDNCASTLLEQSLFDLICVGRQDKHYGPILVQFVEYATPEAITDRIFHALLTLSNAVREDIIVCLSHKLLCPRQLKTLCATDVTFECYYTLAIYQYQHPECSVSDLHETINNFRDSKFGAQLPYLLKEISSSASDNIEKRQLITDYFIQNGCHF